MKIQLKSLMGALILSTSFASVASADKVLLKMPFGFNPKLPNVTTAAKALGETLPMADDSIKVKIYAPGKLVPPFEILDAVSTGKVNSGFAISLYWAGKIPAAAVFSSVPFGPEAGEYLAWYKRGNGEALHRELYDQAGYNVHPLVCGVMAAASGGWYNREINSVEDFDGLKMRTVGLGAKVLASVGVSATSLPVAEIYPALEKGAIDATEVSGPAVDSMLGFPKVAKYNYFPGWQKPSLLFELLVNKDTWNGMNDGQRAAIELACDAAIAETIAEGEGAQFAAMNAYSQKGVEVRRFSGEVLAALETSWDNLAGALSQKDPFFKKAYDDLQAYRTEYKIWRTNAFLPRDTE